MPDVLQILSIAAVVLISLSIHELAHAFVSYLLGDPTAKNMGRLTLNPLKHLDPIGTIMMVASMFAGAGFGWAKPVPINPVYYKRRKLGTMLVSAAGPLSNLLLAFIFAFPLLYFGNMYNLNSLGAFDYRVIIFNISLMFLFANVNLAIFNLLPIPPLDGSKILTGILPARQYYNLMRYEHYIGMAFLALVIIFPRQLSYVLQTVTYPIRYIILSIAQLIVGLFI